MAFQRLPLLDEEASRSPTWMLPLVPEVAVGVGVEVGIDVAVAVGWDAGVFVGVGDCVGVAFA